MILFRISFHGHARAPTILPDAMVLAASGVDRTAPVSAAISIPPGWSLPLTGLAALMVARRRAKAG